ncbi:Unknown protein, partial [Striga hermonthica]
ACLEILSAVDEVKAGGLIRSLQAGPCRTSLAKTPAHTYDEVLRRCRIYINLEETEAEFAKLEELVEGSRGRRKQCHLKGEPRPGERGELSRIEDERTDGRTDLSLEGKDSMITPLNAKVAEVLMAIEKGIDGKDVTWPRS